MSLLLFAAMLAQEPSLTGTLTVDGKAYPIRQLIACEEEDPFDKGSKRIQAVAAVAAVPGDATKSCDRLRMALTEQTMDTSAVTGLVATLTRAKSGELVWESGNLYAAGHNNFFSHSGTEVPTRFEPSQSQASTLAGRLFTTSDRKMEGMPTWSVDLKFTVPLRTLAPKSPAITGADALKHPAVIAARQFLTAMSQGNESALRNLIVEGERAQFDTMMKAPEKAQMLGMMKEMATKALQRQEASIAMRGDVAEVEFVTKEGSGTSRDSFKLRQEQGQWRITRER